MVEQKKGPKQASISAFFSPKKPGEKTEEAKELEATSSAVKRPRVSSPVAQTEPKAQDKTEVEKADEKLPAKKKAATAKSKVKSKAKPKAKAKASPKPKFTKKRQPRRFISPHADVDEDEEDDDLDDEEDVFNTPEARRARAELESGGEIVAAGAPISGDVVVSDGEIVDVSDEDEQKDEEFTIEDKEETVGDAATVDLTAATASVDEGANEAEEKVTKIKSKPAAKNPTKRQQNTNEKAAVAAEAKPAPVEPLDPVIQARVDAYKLKMEELTRQFTQLLHSKQESDALMQDIYGAGLDCDLDMTVEQDKAQQAISETWQKMHEHALSTSNAAEATALPSTVDFPHEVKSLIVKSVQGRASSLSVLTSELLASFKKEVESADVNMDVDSKPENEVSSDTRSVNSAAVLAMEMEIKMLAQRTPHGVRPAKANVFEDTSADAVWIWEVGNLEKYFGDEAQKTVKRMRKNRKRLGQQLKTLARVVQLLQQKPVDEAKVSAEEAKIGKFGFVVDAEVQKAKDRETKEQERRHAVEEKKRHEAERQQAKEEEKRKRELKAEEKEIKSSKRQKVFKSFFVQSKGGLGSETGGQNSCTSDTAIDMTDDQDMEQTGATVESTSAKISRMDAAISFLGSDEDAASSPKTSQLSIFSSLKDKRGATMKVTYSLAPQAWSARRHKDQKLGMMKLLQFYENARPAYYGTFSTQSRLFHGGRRPFAQFSKFDYSVDSDDEWEEEEPGESLSDDDNDGEDSDEDNLDYGDQWLAYEDEVDYIDDENAANGSMERADGPSSPTKHKLPSQLQKKRVKAKAVKPAKLEPQIVGPFWFAPNGSGLCNESPFSGFTAELLVEPAFESTLMRKAREYEEEQKRLEAERLELQRKKEQQQELEKQKVAAAAAQGPPPVEKKATPQKPASQKVVQKKTAPKKSTPAKATPPKVTPQKTPAQKPKSQKVTPQKTPAQKPKPQKVTPRKTPVKQPATSNTGAAKSVSTASSATPSPAKPANPLLDTWLQTKTATSLPKAQQQKEQQEKTEDSSIEVISVD